MTAEVSGRQPRSSSAARWTPATAASRSFAGLDMSVQAGTVLSVLGPNGAGKTTLMMTMAGLLPRLGGTVWLTAMSSPTAVPRSPAGPGWSSCPTIARSFPS